MKMNSGLQAITLGTAPCKKLSMGGADPRREGAVTGELTQAVPNIFIHPSFSIITYSATIHSDNLIHKD